MSARRSLARRLASLSSGEQQRAAIALRELVAKRRAELGLGSSFRTDPGRDPKSRLPYVNDPHAYARDILGQRLVPHQEEMLELFREHRRVIMPSGTNCGKTFALACAALWRFDAVAAVPNVNGVEQGCILVLCGPDHLTIRDTIYAAMLRLRHEAALHGHRIPGDPSDRSVLWQIRPDWYMRALSPPRNKSQNVAHPASGRHGLNMAAIFEEVAGVDERVWSAIEGGFSGAKDSIWCAYNPTEDSSQIRQRLAGGDYIVRRISVLEHPNITERRPVIAAAVQVEAIEARIRTECQDRGSADGTIPDPERRDFVYALPPAGVEEIPGPREDHMPGHPWAEVRVWRPSGTFAAQVLGETPAEGSLGLFDLAALDECVKAWLAGVDPKSEPDRVGVDCAGTGADDTVAAPAWGPTSRELLAIVRDIQLSSTGALAADRRARRDDEEALRLEERLEELRRQGVELEDHSYWVEVARRQKAGESLDEIPDPTTFVRKETTALAGLRKTRRIRIGELRIVPSGTGFEAAAWLRATYPRSPFNLDADGGNASSICDALQSAHGADISRVHFGSAPAGLLQGERPAGNRRAQLYLRAAELVRLRLVEIPPDRALREELLAMSLATGSRWVTTSGGHRREAAILREKAEIRRELGRSPDRADAFVLALDAVHSRGVRF